MRSIEIHFDRVSKRYKIGVVKQSHDTLGGQLTESFKSLFRRNGRLSPSHCWDWNSLVFNRHFV